MAKTKSKKKGGAGRGLAVFLCLVLGVGIIGGTAAWGTGYALTGKANPAEWTGTPKQEEIDKNDVKPTPTDGMTVAPGSSKLMSLRSMPMTASTGATTDSTFFLSATVEPATADDQELEWLPPVFENPSSEWAQGKNPTNFVNVSPTSDTHNATLTCLGDFGEPILITVRSKDNPEATATCKCDYVQRATMLTFELQEEPSLNCFIEYSYTLETTAYTISSEFSIKQFYCYMNYDFFEAVTHRLSDNDRWSIDSDLNRGVNVTVDNEAGTIKIGSSNRPSSMFYEVEDFDGDWDELSLKIDKAFKDEVKTYTGTQLKLRIDYQSVYNGNVYSSGRKEVAVNFKYDSLKIPVQTVSLNQTQIPM